MMDMQKMGQQVLDYYHTAFTNSYNAMLLGQEQMERLSAMYWKKMLNLPEEAQKDLAEWTAVYKKNCAEFKKVMDDKFKKMESYTA
jgi:hypothetical protein